MSKVYIQKLLDKFIPDLDVIKNHKNLQFLGDKLHDPNLWHLNRRSVAMAFAVGLFGAWIPTPGQMAIAAVGALYFRAYLPISVGLVWITNPLTMPPLFYFAYLVGLYLLNLPAADFSLDAILSGDILLPFLTGCFILGVLSASAGYFGINFFWRYHARHKWETRHKNRRHGIKKKNPFKGMY
ncbi:MAG: DUF2062 domain-containing protein [Methylococcales bacterium]|nr:DUF2062 domain-containing protein [Methylococcales bacterium]